jgi:hypothetical protein
MFRTLALVGAIALCVGAAWPARALPPADKDWEIQATFYAWAAGLNADVEAAGITTEIDQSFLDILEDLRWAVMGGVEGRYKRALLLVDTLGMQLVTDLHGGPRTFRASREIVGRSIDADLIVGEWDVHSRLTQWFVDAKPGFRVLSLPMTKLLRRPEDPQDRRRFDVDLLAGIRYWDVTVKNNLEIEPATLEVNGQEIDIPRFGGRLDLGGGLAVPGRPLRNGADGNETTTVDWVDPIVGLRLRADVTRRWSMFVIGDVGGWNIGNASDLTWQAMVGSHFDLSDHWGIGGGFRVLGVDRDPAFQNGLLWGPQFGVTFRF